MKERLFLTAFITILCIASFITRNACMSWLNPVGIILVIPPVLSGIMGLFHSKKS